MTPKKLLLGVVALAFALGLYFLVRPYVFESPPPSVERAMAPDFLLPTLTGVKLRLSDHRGKVVLLDFWATWCTPCLEEIPRFVEMQNKYGDQGLQVIGVSIDDEPEPVREFYRQFKMNYPVVMGDAKTAERYGGILGLPIAFVIDRDGRTYAKHIGVTDISIFRKEVTALLPAKPHSVRSSYEKSLPAISRWPHEPFASASAR